MLNLKRGKGFQRSAANPLLKTLLEGRKIRAVHFRSLSSRAEKSVLSIWRVKNPEQLSTNWNNFKFALNKKSIPTLDLTRNENIELAISELNQNFSEAFVEASKPKFKNTPKILSPEIKSKIHQRNRLRKIWQRTRCSSIYSDFRTLSREIAKDIKSHSCTQWEKHIEALSPVDNTLWGLID
ncbi:hypothetical protein TNCV_1857031 [Trichonephila clavipes]|nr:hypothetical protein TNCV_1857031 [Trichonephila clavipes]